jgi:isocitrate dehydrogenase (NAD+)
VELKSIVVLEGDQTGQELLEESLRVLAPDVIGLELEPLRSGNTGSGSRAPR